MNWAILPIATIAVAIFCLTYNEPQRPQAQKTLSAIEIQDGLDFITAEARGYHCYWYHGHYECVCEVAKRCQN